MSYVKLPTRTTYNLNSASDVNQLQANIEALAGEETPSSDIKTLADWQDDFTANLKTELNASGDAPIYACRAWVNFNGTGTVAIRASGNVSSITDGGTGKYQINFTTEMEDTDFVVAGTTTAEAETGGGDGVRFLNLGSTYHSYVGRAVGYVKVMVSYTSSDVTDGTTVNVAVFR